MFFRKSTAELLNERLLDGYTMLDLMDISNVRIYLCLQTIDFNRCFQIYAQIVCIIASMLSVFTFFAILLMFFCASHLDNLDEHFLWNKNL